MPFLIAFAIGGFWTYECVVPRFPKIYWTGVFIGVLILALGWFLLKVWKSAANEYKESKLRWQRSVLCFACGTSHLTS